MREYLGICALLWVTVFGTWYLVTRSFDKQGNGSSLVTSSERSVADHCSDQMDTLLAMADVLLKAGGPEVPNALRSDVENCISLDAESRSRLGKTQLIRLFPKI